MLEIPESLTIARQINESIRGKRIREAEAAHTPHSLQRDSGSRGWEMVYCRIFCWKRDFIPSGKSAV